MTHHPFKPNTLVFFKFVRGGKQYILGRVNALCDIWNKEYYINHLNNPKFLSIRRFDEVVLASSILENFP